MSFVSSAFCLAKAPATASAMVLASAASLDSWSRLWSLLALVEVAASLSLALSLPITRLKSIENVCIKINSVLDFHTSVLKLLLCWS